MGKSSDVLPPLVKELSKVDIFLHDSEHTYKNMMLEYSTVWPYLSEGGFLISHDIGWNDAFEDFANKVDHRHVKPHFLNMGVIIK